MNSKDTFDFINPAELLQGCHHIPTFTKGSCMQTTLHYLVWREILVIGGITILADVVYLTLHTHIFNHAMVQRFVDCDMLM
jgi:hypothetical protein